MATVAQLAARPYQEVGYLFVVDGWPVCFTNRVELCGTGGSSWIGTVEGARTVVLGLEPPRSVKLGVGIVESGMPVDDSLTVSIVDREGYLVTLMTDDEGSLVYERVDPTSPAPATAIGSNGDAVAIWSAWINGEAIGSAGERRRFPILPGAPTLPGFDHAAIDSADATLRASTVRTAARWLEGLPCALYLIRKDVDAGTWPTWSDQHASGYSLLWWGSLRGAESDSRAWSLSCDGPSAWLRRALNVTMPTEWRSIEPLLELSDSESRIAVAFSYRAPLDASEAGEVSAYTASDVLTSGQTPAELAAEINTRLQDLIDNAGVDINFETAEGGAVSLHDEGLSIRINDNAAGAAGFSLAGVLQLRMHRKVWLHLGWDLVLQSKKQGGNVWAVCDSPYEVAAEVDGDTFYPLDDDAPTSDYGTGYWEAIFTTVPLKADATADPNVADGKGALRTYKPLYGENGSVTVLHPDAQQTVAVGFNDTRYNTGQLACPPANVTIAGGSADRAGFIVVRGPMRDALDEQPRETWQMARVSWRDSDNAVAMDSNRNVLWLQEWLDARLWGGADPPPSKPWAIGNDDDAGNRAQWCPIAVLGYNANTQLADRADLVLLRLLLSSGTAGPWSVLTIPDGDNDHASATGTQAVGNDREIADLGLCIPQQMVDWQSFVDAANALPGGKSGALNRCRLAYVGPFDSQECIESIITPRGWCFSLKDGKYGLFARNLALSIDDVEVELTAADVAADPDATPPAEHVDFRPLEPVDLITLRYGETQLGGGEGRDAELQVKARDPRAAARRGNAKVEIDGRSLLPPRPPEVKEYVSPQWATLFGDLWGNHLARFFGEPHAMVTVAIKGDTARDLWPGTIVSYTSDWPATRNGAYGMTARVGRVVSVERDTQTLAATCQILVEGKDPLIQKRFAPIAVLVNDHATVEERFDASTRTLYCQADAFGRGDGVSDVAAFTEPEWSTTGGNCLVSLYQSWDGVTWEWINAFAVESVDTAAHSITYVNGSEDSSTVWESRFGVLVANAYANQNADEWPRALFGIVCGVDEKHGAGNATGAPWLE